MQALKKSLLAITLVALSLPSQATDYSFCVLVAQTARSTMSMRQSGVPFEKGIEVSDDPKIRAMIKDAYSRHKFLYADFQYQSTSDFSLEYYAKCLDGDY